MNKRLKLSKNRMIGGVCGGIAEYFNLDPTIIRIIWALFTLVFHMTPIVIYIICWAIIPGSDGDEEERLQ
ncbi:MAG: PspC domain-containing protein [Firmicutes bacterium]|nr:PspC domain-containing protein [Bacillota bacterium]